MKPLRARVHAYQGAAPRLGCQVEGGVHPVALSLLQYKLSTHELVASELVRGFPLAQTQPISHIGAYPRKELL